MKKIPQPKAARWEKGFVLLTLAAVAGCTALAFYFAVPLKNTEGPSLPDRTALSEYVRVDLNTADQNALCTLPGVGESIARAILEYRQQNGPFGQVEDAAKVPGLTPEIMDLWKGQATVSGP